MNYNIVHDDVSVGHVDLQMVNLPATPKGVSAPRIFTGELVPFVAYQRIRPIILAQDLGETDFGAPWNTAAEEAALELEFLEASERRPDTPLLELRDETDSKVRVLSLVLSERQQESHAIIVVTAVFPDE
jgi:hypothetical protein